MTDNVQYIFHYDQENPLCLPVGENGVLPNITQEKNKEMNNAIVKMIASSGFQGKYGMCLLVHVPDHQKIILYGCGQGIIQKNACRLGGMLAKYLIEQKIESPQIAFDKDLTALSAQYDITLGMRLRAWQFNTYKPSLRNNHFHAIYACMKDFDKTQQIYKTNNAIYDGVVFARELVSEPGNILYPEEFARRCQALSIPNLHVEVLDEDDMQKLGMGALLGVGQGSERESQLLVMHYNNQGPKQPLAFVGKGVCFDTGGISLKAGPGMEEMIWDMGGGAAVAGAMKTIALSGEKANIVGVIGLVENMPDGKAQRPGDIVKTMNGQTVDIHNTDAEGRLVLADALHYTIDRFKPSNVIDLATLTGAIIISLGHEYAGLMSNDDVLANRLLQSGNVTGEKLWRMPLHQNFNKLIDSPRADMKNIGGKAGGSIVAAQFLQRFVGDTAWAHLDIAGVAWSNERLELSEKGATGFGVRLLHHLSQIQQ